MKNIEFCLYFSILIEDGTDKKSTSLNKNLSHIISNIIK